VVRKAGTKGHLRYLQAAPEAVALFSIFPTLTRGVTIQQPEPCHKRVPLPSSPPIGVCGPPFPGIGGPVRGRACCA
jgi:hypothetical protein